MEMVARIAKPNTDRREATKQIGAKVQTINPQCFELVPIAGDWRHGQAENRLVNTNPTPTMSSAKSSKPIEMVSKHLQGAPGLRWSGLPQHRRASSGI
jgi:hypothetical protein